VPHRPPSDKRDELDGWDSLRRLTAARIGLARTGASLATGPILALRLAHARARDAVQTPLDEARLTGDLGAIGMPVLSVASAVHDRQQYLLRPDLGRQLAADAERVLARYRGQARDVVFAIVDGLSAGAVQAHAAPVLTEVASALSTKAWRVAPLVIVRYGRVAIGDAIAKALGADIAVVLIGERPGLSSPDSMGAYLTWRPGPSTTDADRNCISNIRPDGVGYADAAFKLVHLLTAIRAHQVSGVRLKDDSDRLSLTER
jgi:ethanolamine ammonia-lyase small subunit